MTNGTKTLNDTTYLVCLEMDVWYYRTVSVRAGSEEDARAKALEGADEVRPESWTELTP